MPKPVTYAKTHCFQWVFSYFVEPRGLNPGPVTVPSSFYMLSLLTRTSVFSAPPMPQTTGGEPSHSKMFLQDPAVQSHK